MATNRNPRVPHVRFVYLWEDIKLDDKGNPVIDDKGNPVLAGEIKTVEDFCKATGMEVDSAINRAAQIRRDKNSDKFVDLRNLPSTTKVSSRPTPEALTNLRDLMQKAHGQRQALANAS